MTADGRVSIEILEKDLLLLDGKISDPVIVKVIERIKGQQNITIWTGTDEIGVFLARVLRMGLEKGEIGYRLRYGGCKVCGATGEYPLYKSGPKKGRPNTKKERCYPQVVDFEMGSFVMNYTPMGICHSCWKEARGRLIQVLQEHGDDLKFQWPEAIGLSPKWLKMHRYHCDECGKDSWEEEVGYLPAVMEGYYRGKCPHCGFENRFLGVHKLKEDSRTWKVVPWFDDPYKRRRY